MGTFYLTDSQTAPNRKFNLLIGENLDSAPRPRRYRHVEEPRPTSVGRCARGRWVPSPLATPGTDRCSFLAPLRRTLRLPLGSFPVSFTPLSYTSFIMGLRWFGLLPSLGLAWLGLAWPGLAWNSTVVSSVPYHAPHAPNAASSVGSPIAHSYIWVWYYSFCHGWGLRGACGTFLILVCVTVIRYKGSRVSYLRFLGGAVRVVLLVTYLGGIKSLLRSTDELSL